MLSTLVILLSLFFPLSVQAQTQTPAEATPTAQETIVLPSPTINPEFELFKKYQSDYNYMYEQYKQAYLNYTQKKEIHTKYGTLTTKQEKDAATKSVLIARNSALKAYLTALRIDLDRYKTANPTDTSKYQIELQKLENWFDEKNTVISAINNDEDIKSFATEFDKKYITIQQTIYTSLALHQINHKKLILAQIQSLSDEIKSDSRIDNQQTDWQGTQVIKTDLTDTALKSAYSATQVKQSTQRFSNFYPNSKKEITKAVQYLTDMLSDLKAIVIRNYQQ